MTNTVANAYIDKLIQSAAKCTVYLANGVRLSNCTLLEHDDHAVSMTSVDKEKRKDQLAFKHSIATIVIE